MELTTLLILTNTIPTLAIVAGILVNIRQLNAFKTHIGQRFDELNETLRRIGAEFARERPGPTK